MQLSSPRIVSSITGAGFWIWSGLLILNLVFTFWFADWTNRAKTAHGCSTAILLLVTQLAVFSPSIYFVIRRFVLWMVNESVSWTATASISLGSSRVERAETLRRLIATLTSRYQSQIVIAHIDDERLELNVSNELRMCVEILPRDEGDELEMRFESGSLPYRDSRRVLTDTMVPMIHHVLTIQADASGKKFALTVCMPRATMSPNLSLVAPATHPIKSYLVTLQSEAAIRPTSTITKTRDSCTLATSTLAEFRESMDATFALAETF